MKRISDEQLKAEAARRIRTQRVELLYSAQEIAALAKELLIYRNLERIISANCKHHNTDVRLWSKLAMQDLAQKFKEAGLDP